MKALPAPSPKRAASLWMRVCVGQFAAVTAILAGAALLVPAPVRAAEGRPLFLALTAGTRVFDDAFTLESRAAFGARIGLGVTDRISVWIDALTCSPTRQLSRTRADVTMLRAVMQARLLTGRVRPYVVLGAGGAFYDYENAYDSAGAAITAGGGADLRVAPRTFLFAEATADLHRTRTVNYSDSGQEISYSDSETAAHTAFLAGIAVEF